MQFRPGRRPVYDAKEFRGSAGFRLTRRRVKGLLGFEPLCVSWRDLGMSVWSLETSLVSKSRVSALGSLQLKVLVEGLGLSQAVSLI